MSARTGFFCGKMLSIFGSLMLVRNKGVANQTEKGCSQLIGNLAHMSPGLSREGMASFSFPRVAIVLMVSDSSSHQYWLSSQFSKLGLKKKKKQLKD